MYTAFSSNRKDYRLTINGKKHDGEFIQKKLTKFYLEYIHHQMIQDILDFNQCAFLSDFILDGKKLRTGTYSRLAKKYNVNPHGLCQVFKKGLRLERLKLKNMGIPTKQ